MPKFANFVQCSLVAGITAGATTIQVEAQAPFNLPANPAGQTATITLMDNSNVPTTFEIITYTGLTVIDANSVELTGCARGQEGTTAQAWDDSTVVRQDVTGNSLERISLFDQARIYSGSEDTAVREFRFDGTVKVLTTAHSDAITSVFVNADIKVFSMDDSGLLIKSDENGLTEASVEVGMAGPYSPGIVGATSEVVLVTDSNRTGVEVRSAADLSVLRTVSFAYVEINGVTDNAGNSYIKSKVGVNWGIAKFDVSGNFIWFSAVGDMSPNVSRSGTVIAGGGDSATKISAGGIADVMFDLNLLMISGYTYSVVGVTDSLVFMIVGDALRIYNYSGDLQATIPRSVNGGGGDLKSIGNDFVVFSESESVPEPLLGGGNESSRMRMIDVRDPASPVIVWDSSDAFSDFVGIDILDTTAMPIFFNGFETKQRFITKSDVEFGQSQDVNSGVFAASTNIQTPAAGVVYIYQDVADGALKAKFSNGTTEIIASP